VDEGKLLEFLWPDWMTLHRFYSQLSDAMFGRR
jgi:GTP1/Obg family GTP-binding protein